MSSSGTILPNSHLTWNKPITPSSHWRTPRPRYSPNTFAMVLFYFCTLCSFPMVFKRQFNQHGFLRHGVFSFLFLGWCYETGCKGNEESIQASENRPDWGEMCTGFPKNIHLFLKESKWLCMWWGEHRRGIESWVLPFTNRVTLGKGTRGLTSHVVKLRILIPHTVIIRMK